MLQLFSHILRTNSSTHSPLGPALLYCPGKVQVCSSDRVALAYLQLSQLLQVVKGDGNHPTTPHTPHTHILLPHSCPQAQLTCTPPGPVLLCCLDEVQIPLSRMLQLVRDRASLPTLITLGQVLPTAANGKGITITSTPPHVRGVSGQAFPCSHTRDWLIHTHSTRASPTVLPKQGTGPALSRLDELASKEHG